MNYVGITQRVDPVPGRDERRDALDQAWWSLLCEAGLSPLILPNDEALALHLIAQPNVSGIILSGGNDLLACGGNAPERDATESALLRWALDRHLPVFGICRGMQLIQAFFGVSLGPVQGHVAQALSVTIEEGSFLDTGANCSREVMGYHNWGTCDSVSGIRVVARSDDGVVMGIQHISEALFGVMWHPERDRQYREYDVAMLGRIFGGATG